MSLVDRTTILTTPRLALTTWLPSDVDDLLVVHSDAETMRFVRDGRPETREQTERLVTRYRTEHRELGYTKWRLADRGGSLVGRAGFGPRADGRELGYTLRRDAWGQGLATEIAQALVAWHRAHAPGVALHAYVAVENAASRRVLAKVGFEPIASEVHHGVPSELLLLPLTHGSQLRPA